jgi:hypothetical protein
MRLELVAYSLLEAESLAGWALFADIDGDSMTIDLTVEDFQHELFGEITFAEFRKSIHRRDAHFVQGSKGRFDNIFHPADFDRILNEQMLHRPSIRMAGEGRILPLEAISRNIQYGAFAFENVVDMSKVDYWFQRGYTINLRGAHFFHPGLRSAAQILGELFGCRVRANLYLTPHKQSGLVPHYDVHDVLVLQLVGGKQWNFYQNNFKNPTERSQFQPTDFNVGEVVNAVLLNEGDLLYVPRGVSHSAVATSKSLHITFGIEEPVVGDVLLQLIRGLESNENFRKAIASISDCEGLTDDASRAAKLRQFLVEAIQGANVENAIEVVLKKSSSPSTNVAYTFV